MCLLSYPLTSLSFMHSCVHSLTYSFIHTSTNSLINLVSYINTYVHAYIQSCIYAFFLCYKQNSHHSPYNLPSIIISLTGGESNVESASNIARLSSTLSWLDSFREDNDDVTTVITHCARRSLIYPYIRYVITDIYDSEDARHYMQGNAV